MDNLTYRNYLRDLVYLIKERHYKLKAEKMDDNFKSGIEFGYFEVLDLIENQAKAFQIELADFGFNDYEKFTKRG